MSQHSIHLSKPHLIMSQIPAEVPESRFEVNLHSESFRELTDVCIIPSCSGSHSEESNISAPVVDTQIAVPSLSEKYGCLILIAIHLDFGTD